MKNQIEFKICNQGDNAKAFKEAEELIKSYQKKFHIQDWRIQLYFVSAATMEKEMGSSEYVGSCKKYFYEKAVDILVNIEHSRVNEEIESTIRHELLHVVTREFERWALIMADKMPDKEHFIEEVEYHTERMVEQLDLIIEEIESGN